VRRRFGCGAAIRCSWNRAGGRFATYSQWENQIALPCPETTLALSEIYERIAFDDAL
jgi:hypothetical protein